MDYCKKYSSSANSGYSLSPNTTLDVDVISLNPDNDLITANWLLDGSTSEYLTNITELPNGSAVKFTPPVALAGAHTITVALDDGLDVTTCTWPISVVESCAIAQSNPATGANVKMAATGGSTQFTVIPNNNLCTVAYTLNGVSLNNNNNPAVTLLSNQLLVGANILQVMVGNGANANSATWTVIKNIAPSCAAQAPAVSGNGLNPFQVLNLSMDAGNIDNDPLTYAWKMDGMIAPVYLSPTDNGNSSSAIFSPDLTLIGTHTLSAIISDGHDTSYCSWNVKVVPFCEISSATPALSSTSKISEAPTGTMQINVFPNQISCLPTFTLNGVVQNTGSNSYIVLQSSNLLAGSNLLEIVVNDGYSTDSGAWTIVKNTASTCDNQNPASTGNSLNYTQTMDFDATATNPDGDSLIFSWLLDGTSAPTYFSGAISAGNDAGVTFVPDNSKVGMHTVSLQINDGYDSALCSWAVQVIDPSVATINLCTPTIIQENPVVITSTGANSTRSFSVDASGTGLTYEWQLDGVTIGGATSGVFNLNAGSVATGEYVLRAIVTDIYNNSDFCEFNIKKNAPPIITVTYPPLGAIKKINYASLLSFQLSGADGNGDNITYTWSMNGNSNAHLPANTQRAPGDYLATFHPDSDISTLGRNTIRVVASDGVETDVKEWTVDVNYFSTICNDIMSDPTSASNGKTCTLVGSPIIGSNVTVGPNEDVDQYFVRTQPRMMVVDHYPDPDDSNVIFSDATNHVIWYYNRSNDPVTRFGSTIAPYTLKVIAGLGQAGLSQTTPLKFSTPVGLALNADDNDNPKLYIADYSNNYVYELDNDYNLTVVLGTGANGTGDHAAPAAGNTVICQNPFDLVYIRREQISFMWDAIVVTLFSWLIPPPLSPPRLYDPGEVLPTVGPILLVLPGPMLRGELRLMLPETSIGWKHAVG